MRQEEGGETSRDHPLTASRDSVRSPPFHDSPQIITYQQGGAVTRSRAAAAVACLAASISVVVLAGFTSSSSSPATQVKKGGTLRIGTISGYDSMNPFVAYSSQSYDAFIEQYP